jgi:hypothetical protein
MLVLTKLRKYIIKNVSDKFSASLIYINNIGVGYSNRRIEHDIYLCAGCKKYTMTVYRSFTLFAMYNQNWILYESYKKVNNRWIKIEFFNMVKCWS